MMSDSAPVSNGNSRAELPFSEEEWSGFRASDRGVTAVVVGLLTGLFLLGLALYVMIVLEI